MAEQDELGRAVRHTTFPRAGRCLGERETQGRGRFGQRFGSLRVLGGKHQPRKSSSCTSLLLSGGCWSRLIKELSGFFSHVNILLK